MKLRQKLDYREHTETHIYKCIHTKHTHMHTYTFKFKLPRVCCRTSQGNLNTMTIVGNPTSRGSKC